MKENLVRILRQYSLRFDKRLLPEEQMRLHNSGTNPDSEIITVKQYLESFRISTEGEKARERLSRISGESKVFRSLVELMLAPKPSLDEFLRFTVPMELIEITQSRIDQLVRQAQDHYASLYDNAHLLGNPDRFLNKLNKYIYDFGVFSYYAGTAWIIRDSVALAREDLRKRHNKILGIIQKSTPNIALTILDAYQKFERRLLTRPEISEKPRVQYGSNPTLGEVFRTDGYSGIATAQTSYSEHIRK